MKILPPSHKRTNVKKQKITNNDEKAYMERSGSVVPGQQPLSQREQDKVADCGLQEKEG